MEWPASMRPETQMNHAPVRPNVILLLPFLHYGVGRLVLYLAEALKQRQTGCILVTCGRTGDLGDDPGMIEEISKSAIPFRHTDIFSRDAADMKRAVQDVGELWREHRPVFAHAFTAPAAAACLPHGPVLATVVGWGEKKQTWQKQMDVSILDLCAGVTAVSGAAAEELSRAGLQRSDVALIRNGVALEECPRRAWASGATVRLGVMAHLIPRKGVDVLLKALPHVAFPDRIEVLIAGTGETEEELKKCAAVHSHSGNIVWLGQRPVEEFLAEIDILVVPSRSDALPLVLLQGMARGLPIVASAVGGITEALESGEEGLLVPPDDPASLAKAIQRFLVNPETARSFGLRAQQRAKRDFSARTMLHSYFESYFKMYPDPRFLQEAP